MAGITRKVHLRTAFDYGPVNRFAPDLDLTQPADAGGGQPTTPNAICFVDPRDAETHVFVISEEGRKQLISALTGGVVMPDGVT